MKQKILLLLVAFVCFAGANAQKKSKNVTAYAITATEKGNSRWTEVRLVDLNSGEEVQSIYNSSSETVALNARTGKPIVKKEIEKNSANKDIILMKRDRKLLTEAEAKELLSSYKLNNNDNLSGRNIEIRKVNEANEPGNNGNSNVIIIRKSIRTVNSDAPFATQSAACAYDKKHDRLYYTPMGINQLRYIDLKSKTPQIFYFEDEPLGALSSPGDVPNQVTRMVIGGDGNGYALTNNAEHLIRFTTNKKGTITDLGSLTDDASNGKYSVHSGNGYGGDIIADKYGNLYLITANRAVFKINIDSKIATFKGLIKGLPRGFTTNGAAVENGTNVIVTSSTSTSGYYMFDLNTMEAQKISASENVFNASDLANGNLVSEKKKNRKEEPAAQQPQEAVTETSTVAEKITSPAETANKLTVYPNPVTNGVANLSFTGYTPGRYELQLLDLNGKMIQSQPVTISSKLQTQELKLPATIAKGNYLVKLVNETGRVINAEKLIVQ